MVKLGKFYRLRKNKSFKYTPRYYENEGEDSPYKITHKFDKYRTTVGSNRGLKRKWQNAMDDLSVTGDKYMRLRILIIVSILILIFLYIIDFDLSIFFKG